MNENVSSLHPQGGYSLVRNKLGAGSFYQTTI